MKKLLLTLLIFASILSCGCVSQSDLDTAVESARDEGYSEGYSASQSEMDAAIESARDEGYSEGYATGYSHGYAACQQETAANAANESNAVTASSTSTDDYSSEMVVLTRTGSKYHTSSCRYVKGKTDTSTISLSEAKAAGYTACKVCH